MTERKCCITCKLPLIRWMGNYLHPEEVCAGLTDYIDIEGEVKDEFLNKKFVALYGTPSKDDYEEVTILLKHKQLLIEKISKDKSLIEYHKQLLNKPLVNWVISVINFFNKR